MWSNSTSGINTLLAKYSAVDFGIGLDDGNILCAKVGVGGDNNTKDLIWIGNPVNKSVVISNECKASYHIGISSRVYNNLLDDVKYGKKKDYMGIEREVDMWQSYYVTYNGKQEVFYKTSWHWTVY
ncbi:MAG: hypothetical protein EOO85_24740 [Pedobacter sp.]|nr:MAG: hypothetical protein EOO85_24740 [Pedobacter sp.]